MNDKAETVDDVLAQFPNDFNGDDGHLVRCIEALLSLDAKDALAPHGIGGHARGLLSAAMHRLSRNVERAMAASAVPVAEVVGREPYLDGAPNPMHSLNWRLRNCENELPIGTKLYAHAPHAVPVESQPDEVIRKAMEHMLRGGAVKIECIPDLDMRVPVESLGRDAPICCDGVCNGNCDGDPVLQAAAAKWRGENSGTPPPVSVPDGWAPTDEQFRDWCKTHDMQESVSREAFDDASSLYLLATTPEPRT